MKAWMSYWLLRLAQRIDLDEVHVWATTYVQHLDEMYGEGLTAVADEDIKAGEFAVIRHIDDGYCLGKQRVVRVDRSWDDLSPFESARISLGFPLSRWEREQIKKRREQL